jgi:hypothetical protein
MFGTSNGFGMPTFLTMSTLLMVYRSKAVSDDVDYHFDND